MLTSGANPRLKLVRRLHARRTREREGCFAVEGEDLVAAGIAAGRLPRFVLADADGLDGDGAARARSAYEAAEAAGVDCQLVAPGLLAADSQLAHHARLWAVFDLPERADPARPPEGRPVAFLDGIRDPGNVGTLLRTALMLGVEDIALGHGTADPYGPKAIRASMGAIFHVHCAHLGRGSGYLQAAAEAGRAIVGLDPAAAAPLARVELPPDAILCIGSERDGLGEQVRAACTVTARIPQLAAHDGRPDSLNAAVAGGIMLYQWQLARQGPA